MRHNWSFMAGDDIKYTMHVLVVNHDQIEEDLGTKYTDDELSLYLVYCACEKANRLGKEKVKMKKFDWEHVEGNNSYELTFYCEAGEWI